MKMSTSNNIKKLRKSLGMSQAEFSTEIKIHYSTLSRIESNDRKPSMKIVNKICEVFKIDINELVDPNDNLFEENRATLKLMFKTDRPNNREDAKGVYIDLRGGWINGLGFSEKEPYVSIKYDKKKKEIQIFEFKNDDEKFKIKFNKRFKTFTIWLKNKWINDMGLSNDNRTVAVVYDPKKKIISIKVTKGESNNEKL